METQKIYILGISGSGKSYLAKLLSEKLKISYCELDDIYWSKKYSEKLDKDERVEKLNKIVKKEKWIMEGVYSSWVLDAINSADLVIWLKTPVHKRIFRIVKRKLKNYDRDTWRGTFDLVRYSLMYRVRRKKANYSAHKNLLKENNIEYTVVKSKKDFSGLLEELK